MLSWLMLAALRATSAPRADYGKIELIRDTWGIPHVFSETDAGAMYGLGYATAEERGFQMTYNLRIIQGRLSEVIGEKHRGARKETSMDHDRQMRTMGWVPAAARAVTNLDLPTRKLLDAYCEGVNGSFASQRAAGRLHPLFKEMGVVPEPWTARDCLLSWWHLAQFFASDGTRDLLVWHNRVNPRPGQPQPVRPNSAWQDDSAAVVQREDVADRWLKRVEAYGSIGKVQEGGGGEGPKFSHAWVVGGKKTNSGAAVLVSDPQTPVRNPSLWMEFHVSGKTLNARGIGVPGSPGLLIGFTRGVAWGLTALGADQADLFRLQTDSEHPDEYRWDGKWRKYQSRTERIKVKGEADVEFVVRETHVGPVVTPFCFPQHDDPEVALKRIPMCDTERDTISAVFAMMRAKDAKQFAKALSGWRFPTANCVYGDAGGHIGYAIVGAIPRRSASAPEPNGNEALPGSGDRDDWQGYVPHELLPHVEDPGAGFLLSANHRPVGSFYRIPLGISTGSMGDTIRSWRLRERLQQKEKFTTQDVFDIQHDSVNPARREIIRLGLHLRETKQGDLSNDALKALDTLEPWFKAGASSDLTAKGAELATRISTFFRFIATPLALKFGGGESGLARFLKDSQKRIEADHKAKFDEDETRFINKVLTDAWADESENGRNTAAGGKLGWFDSLDGFGSLDISQDLKSAGITCLDGQTIKSQAAQSYTQWVSLDDVDSAMTICPIGHSDRVNSPWRTSTMGLWGEGSLHVAPISRKAVGKIAATREILSQSAK
jgi:penicillin amidase